MDKLVQDNQEIMQRVIIFLNREQLDFLDKLGKDTLFSGKKKLSRTKIIARLVDLLRAFDINGNDVVSEESLKHKMREKLELDSSKGIFNFHD